jgi:hypothetical protein
MKISVVYNEADDICLTEKKKSVQADIIWSSFCPTTVFKIQHQLLKYKICKKILQLGAAQESTGIILSREISLENWQEHGRWIVMTFL